MNMPIVEITTTKAELGMKTSRPPLEIRQPPADIEINQHFNDTVEISTKAAKVNIDQSEAFADADLIPPLQQGDQFAAKAKRTAMEYVAKKAQEGEQLKAVEKNGGGGKAIAAIAKENGKLIEKQVELGFTPESAFKVKFDAEPGDISFQVERAEADINVQKNDPEINIPRWEIQHYLKQKPSIEFHVSGEQINRRL
ncbi:DUF6470 family protein [Alteribacillus sp. JSM 102045]|uniref:DUF6470 family protein n=1 Tax=Alteribacillus sp. JSM 102045 TaxID=1562101 RepID=UPI0035C120F4